MNTGPTTPATTPPPTPATRPTAGPLRVHPANGRYFADAHGRAVYLAGSHTWANWIEHKLGPDEPDFDYDAYLDFMAAHNHNFMRFWGWEHARWATWDGTGRFHAYPLAYPRTGPGTALDGLPRFDLTRFDPDYFHRLRTRLELARDRGIYAAVKFFDGFSVGFKGPQRDDRWVDQRNPYRGHPFHPANNINGIDADPTGTGEGKAIHTLTDPQITALQEAYVRKVIDTVNDLDNVLYEICNESDRDEATIQWQYHFIDFVRQDEATRPCQHPVGMTVPYPGENAPVFASSADWVSPNAADEPYRDDPPPADGSKVIVADTDHLWGHGGDLPWVWKSFIRGHNLLLMDPWEPLKGSDLHDNNYRDHPTWEPIRRAMGDVRRYAARIDLAACHPAGELASTGYCLAAPGRQCLVYQPQPGPIELDLTAFPGRCAVEWFDPRQSRATPGEPVEAGRRLRFDPPFTGDAVLYVAAAHEA